MCWCIRTEARDKMHVRRCKLKKSRPIKAFNKLLGSMAIPIVIIEGVVYMQRAYNK
jgi:hypothetical protein